MTKLSSEAASIMRIIAKDSKRTFDGDELLERIFATTTERPLDPPQVCDAIRQLESLGFATVCRDRIVLADYDFLCVRITDAGLAFWRG
jgi:hypothetical protein